MKKCALHGFLGRPSDWDFLPGWETVDLFRTQVPLAEWGRWFNENQSTDLLMGYSMGGRLALHALLDAPERFLGAILISANPNRGMPTNWAQRFRRDPWDKLMVDWNRQPVFAGDAALERTEYDFDREALAEALELWSSDKQENLLPRVQELEIPLLWIVGENDAKYVEMARGLSLKHPLSKIWVAKGSGHRVPWAVQRPFTEQINHFQEAICPRPKPPPGPRSRSTPTSN